MMKPLVPHVVHFCMSDSPESQGQGALRRAKGLCRFASSDFNSIRARVSRSLTELPTRRNLCTIQRRQALDFQTPGLVAWSRGWIPLDDRGLTKIKMFLNPFMYVRFFGPIEPADTICWSQDETQ